MDKVTVFDFGSQYTQLIARRVRELNVFCEILPYHQIDQLDDSTKAIILSGSPLSVKSNNKLDFDLDKIIGICPILGICYGAQYMADYLGGEVGVSEKREYGRAEIQVLQSSKLFEDVADPQIWMSHADSILALPEGFVLTAKTESIPVAAFESIPKAYSYPVIGIQFHPEVTHTYSGLTFLRNFVIHIAGCAPAWTPKSFVTTSIETIRNKVGEDHVLLALSGGVDSSVAAQLLHQAIGPRLHCYFIDNGLLRYNEYDQVLESYKQLNLNITGVDAGDRFLDALSGVSDPETKRKIIGELFIRIFEEQAKSHPEVKWLAQGTIYPDVIESVSVHGPSVTIKSHHNVGGLPDVMGLHIIEPLRSCFKDEVRKVGRELDLPPVILNRHPFPGPGLAIRILGDITKESVAILQQADDLFIKGLHQANLYHDIWQALAILLPVQSVGVMGDERTYEKTIVLRAVTSVDGMTADWARLPQDFLASISNQIINTVKGVNRVVYDISSKPPATIEWE